jgi:hypothetical protein
MKELDAQCFFDYTFLKDISLLQSVIKISQICFYKYFQLIQINIPN